MGCKSQGAGFSWWHLFASFLHVFLVSGGMICGWGSFLFLERTFKNFLLQYFFKKKKKSIEKNEILNILVSQNYGWIYEI